MISNAELGRRIRAIRKARGLTQAQLSKVIGGRTGWTIYAHEHDIKYLDAPHLEALCRALDVTVAQITSDNWMLRCQRGKVKLEEALRVNHE